MIVLFTAIFLILTIFICSALCFKISGLLKTIGNLNTLVSRMIEEGVSPNALELAVSYYREKKVKV